MTKKYSVVYDNQGQGSEHKTLIESLYGILSCFEYYTQAELIMTNLDWQIYHDDLGVVMEGTANNQAELIITAIYPGGKEKRNV